MECAKHEGGIVVGAAQDSGGMQDARFRLAVGWLMREDKIVIIREGRTFRVGLKRAEAKAAGAK